MMNILPKSSPNQQSLGPEQVVREALGVRVEVGTVGAENLKRAIVYQLPHVDFSTTIAAPEQPSVQTLQTIESAAEPIASVPDMPIHPRVQTQETSEDPGLADIYQRISEAQNEAA